MRVKVRRHSPQFPASVIRAMLQRGSVAFLTIGLDGASSLADAHEQARAIEERIRRLHLEIAEVHVPSEP